MSVSGLARRRGQFRRRVRACAAASAAAILLGAGAAQIASANSAVIGRHRPVVAGAKQMHIDVPGQECFFTFPNCTSADPSVSFVMSSNGDTTGCVFTQDTAWGDGTDTVLTYVGAANGAPIATFTHAYGAPGDFKISFTITVTDNPNKDCGGGKGSLGFTLLAPPRLSCVSSQVTVPASTVAVSHAREPLSIAYGLVPLTFRPRAATGGEKCAMQPAASVQPIGLKIPNVATPIQLGQSDSTATLDLIPASSLAAAIPSCDFGALQALTNPSITPPFADFADTNNCLLTPTFHASWDTIAQWTVPGIVLMAHNQATNSDIAVYSTQPLTYYVDLDTLPLPHGFSGDTLSALVDFIYSTLAQNLPVPDRVALIQGSTAHLRVTNPFGRSIRLDSNNRVHSFNGAGYVRAGGRSIAWILEPVPGAYHVKVRGRAGSGFNVHVADLQFLGHGSAPLAEDFEWHGVLGPGGTAGKRFSVHGSALSPALNPHESAAVVKPLTLVHFTLANSVIPQGIAKVAWRFGDGTGASASPTSHRYQHSGHYAPSVTVSDALGYTATVNLPVIVVSG